jgi:ABC-type transporter Mla subunit MlaD
VNENHQRAILAALAQVDAHLDEVEAATGRSRSPFSRLVQDLSPAQRREVRARVAALRARLVEALDALGVPRPPAATRASWAILTCLSFARMLLTDLTAARLGSGGPLDPETGAAVERWRAELMRELEDFSSRLTAETSRA